MAQDEEQSTESNMRMTISELPGKPFNFYMEISLFLLMIGATLSETPLNNIVLYRTCVHSLHHSVDDCKGFLLPGRTNETKHLEEPVQKYVTFVTTVRTVVESLGPAFLSLFLGVWSDTHGRKPLIVWPLFGLAVSGMSIVVYALLDNFGPWWYILSVIPLSVTGGFSVLFTGAYCYLSDVSTTENRSIRMTLVGIAISAGSIIGSLSCSNLLRAVGNVYLLLIASTLFVSAYAISNVWLIESLTGAVKGSISSVLDFLLVKEMITECFKRRPNYLRAQILLLTLANSLNVFIIYGVRSLVYMYTRKKLDWALGDYNAFSATSVLLSFVGSFVGVGLIQKYCGVSDLAFSIIAYLTSAVEYTIKAFAVVTWQMYLGSAVSTFGGLSSPLIRSFLTKILPVQDIAKVFALMCAIEGVFPLISPAIYNSLYNVTISSFPGAVFLLTSAINIMCMTFLLIVAYFRWKSPTVPYQPVESNSTEHDE